MSKRDTCCGDDDDAARARARRTKHALRNETEVPTHRKPPAPPGGRLRAASDGAFTERCGRRTTNDPPAEPGALGGGVFLVVVALCLLFASTCFTATAQPDDVGDQAENAKHSLVVSLFPLGGRGRSYAPLPVVMQLDFKEQLVDEGVLEMQFYDGMERVASFRTAPMAIAPGQQRVMLTLPPLPPLQGTQTMKVAMRWRGKRMTLRPPPIALMVNQHNSRSTVIAHVTAGGVATAAHRDAVGSLRLTTLSPHKGENARLRTLETFVAKLSADVLPKQALGYCGYNVVVLSGGGLALASAEQLAALRDWVRGGGSLCVIADDAIGPVQLQFLNELGGFGARAPVYTLTDTGTLQWPADAPAPMQQYRTGLGRVVVLSQAPVRPDDSRARPAPDNREEALTFSTESSRWREATCFLWKFTKRQTNFAKQRGRWSTGEQDHNLIQRYQQRVYYSARGGAIDEGDRVDTGQIQYYRHAAFGSRDITGALLPDDIRMVPMGLIALILVVFLVAVGPLDYYLLGAMRLRVLTWLLFPLLSAAFMWFTIKLSQDYMGTQDRGASLTVYDVVDPLRKGEGLPGEPDTVIARENKLSLMFAGTYKTVVHEVNDAVFTPIDESQLRGSGHHYGREQSLTVVPPVYNGRIAQSYAVTQRLSQWTPQLNRTLRITPAKPKHDIDWDAINGDLLGSVRADRYEVGQRVSKVIPPGSSAMVLHRGRWHHIVGEQNPIRAEHRIGYDYYYEKDYENTTFLRAICGRGSFGMFSVVSQLSPTGGDHLEDLPMLDSTDESQLLFVLVIKDDAGNFHVYRKLCFRGLGE